MAADPAFDAAASALTDKGVDGPIECALVLGTGLGSVVEDVQDAVCIPYADIPGFPQGAVSGHARQLCYGTLFGRKVLIYQGRAHYYEGGDPAEMRPGSLALITDHINLNGPNPLVGDRGDGRFVPMVDAYDPLLRGRLKRAAQKVAVPLGEGVY